MHTFSRLYRSDILRGLLFHCSCIVASKFLNDVKHPGNKRPNRIIPCQQRTTKSNLLTKIEIPRITIAKFHSESTIQCRDKFIFVEFYDSCWPIVRPSAASMANQLIKEAFPIVLSSYRPIVR